MGIITDIEHYQSHARRKLYKGPINEPCSACGDGDTAMEYHDHDQPSPSYTLADLERLAHEYADGSDASSNLQSSEDALKFRLYLGMFIVWLGKKEREANERGIQV